jgi:AcrR family transcriptional regulator
MGRPERVTRQQVMRAAREAFAARGYDGTTLAAISSRLGLSPAALLRHAPSKEALFTAALSEPAEEGKAFPLGFLAEVGGEADPRPVLRRFARTAIPFIEAQLGENVARWMYAKTSEEARTLRLPFDPRSRDTPPRRAFALLEDYFRRAVRAGRLRVPDPRAAALAFLGGLNAYVFFHHVVRVVEPAVPMDHYVDALVDIWTRGVCAPPRSRPALRRKR